MSFVSLFQFLSPHPASNFISPPLAPSPILDNTFKNHSFLTLPTFFFIPITIFVSFSNFFLEKNNFVPPLTRQVTLSVSLFIFYISTEIIPWYLRRLALGETYLGFIMSWSSTTYWLNYFTTLSTWFQTLACKILTLHMIIIYMEILH